MALRRMLLRYCSKRNSRSPHATRPAATNARSEPAINAAFFLRRTSSFAVIMVGLMPRAWASRAKPRRLRCWQTRPGDSYSVEPAPCASALEMRARLRIARFTALLATAFFKARLFTARLTAAFFTARLPTARLTARLPTARLTAAFFTARLFTARLTAAFFTARLPAALLTALRAIVVSFLEYRAPY